MIQPYIRVINEFEKKPLLFAWFCVFTHIVIKKLFKEKKVAVQKFEFLEALLKNSADFQKELL